MRVLPLLPVAAALGLVAVLRPDLLTGFGASWRAWLVVVGVALAGTATRLAVRRWSPGAAPWASSGVVLALLGVLLLPSFHERTVVEAFPPVTDAAATAPVTAAPSTAPPTAGPSAAVAPAPAAKAPARRPSATATRLVTGSFHGIGHSAAGRASLYDVSGKIVLRFEHIDFQGTPSPSVHLVRNGRRSPAGGIRLGALKAEHGSFSYLTPAGFDLTAGWTVLVWCDTYDVPIAAADLR